jgi:hypothetical protein
MKLACSMLCLTGLILLTVNPAQAQVRRNVRPPIAKYQPYTSPALNMLGPGGPEFGYFTGTQPQEQFRQQQYNFNRDFMNFEKQVNSGFKTLGNQESETGIRRTIGTTGHPTSFMNTYNYFPARR